jgi:hypothetical protein
MVQARSECCNRAGACHDVSVAMRAIAKARAWVEDLASARISSFAEIAAREGIERHVRFLAPLAFVSPRRSSTDIDPLAWLADVLARIVDTTQSRLPELVPSENSIRPPFRW